MNKITYVQCDNFDETYKVVDAFGGCAFVTEDNRVHETIHLCDDFGTTKMMAYEIRALWDLKTTIECYGDPACEMGFGELIRAAKECEDAWVKCLKRLKLKGKR